MFFEGSRYENVPTAELVDARGQRVRYKTVRFIGPATRRWTHAVSQSERIDHVAHRYYRDPERFWRICDANRALWPDDLLADVGALLRIPPAQE
jgi:hypothetical protein